MNGVIYCRVSSKEQVQGTSLESQEAACREFARQHNLSVLRTFIELGESAKFAARTQLLELIDYCRENKGKIEQLLVWKLDRFSRNVGDHFSVKAALAKYGVRIVSVTEPIDTNPEGKLMETILAGFAQFDNDIRALRTVQGMRRKLQEGIFPWGPPLGYVSSTVDGKKKAEPDRPDQPVFGLLRKAWRLFATGAYSKAEIRRLMAKWGIATRKGRPLSAQSTDNMFGNKYYRGTLIDPWSGDEYQGKHIPLVTGEEFARVQQIVKRRNRSIPHQKVRPEFPLRGLVRCSGCERYLMGSLSRGRSRRYAYYHCKSRTCARYAKGLPVKDVHDEFKVFLTEIAPKPELLEKLGELILRRADEHQASLAARRKRAEAAQTKLQHDIQELVRMRVQGLLTDKEFLVQKSMLTEKLNVIQVDLAAPDSAAVKGVRQCLEQIKSPLNRLPETWATLSPPDQRRFDRLILPVGFVHGKSGTIELGLLFSTIRALQDGNSSVVPLTGKNWNLFLKEITEFSALLRGDPGPEEGLIGAV